MSRSFGIEVAMIDDDDIAEGLAALSRPPEWLVAIEDRKRLREEIERSVPELASGAQRLTGAKFKRARIVDGTWSSLCRLKVESPDDGAEREIDIRGTLVMPGEAEPPTSATVPFPRDGWHCYLPELRWAFELEPPDSALPGLDALTDPERSRGLLEDALRHGAEGLDDLRLATCAPTVKRYREGRRCAIRYELGYDSDDRPARWPEGVLAKVYEGAEARATYEGMVALWESPLQASSTVTIAEPLALVADRHVVVQSLVPGDRTLKEVIKKSFADGVRPGIDALAPHVGRAGRALAELHASGVKSGPVVTWEDQVAAVRHASEDLASAIPALAEATGPLVARLEALAAQVPAGPLVTTHHSFRPAQLLLDDDRMALIDFDGICQAEAGLDLALFRITLTDLCLRALEDAGVTHAGERGRQRAELDELSSVFLDGYQEVGQVSPERLALWDALTGTKDILDCWRKVKFEHLERRMDFLHAEIGSS